MWDYDDWIDYVLDNEERTSTTGTQNMSTSFLPLRPGHTYMLNNSQEAKAMEGPSPDHVFMDIPGSLQYVSFLKSTGRSVGHFVDYYVVSEVEDKTLRLPPTLHRIVAEHTGLTALKAQEEKEAAAQALRDSTPPLDPYETYRTLCDLTEWEPE